MFLDEHPFSFKEFRLLLVYLRRYCELHAMYEKEGLAL